MDRMLELYQSGRDQAPSYAIIDSQIKAKKEASTKIENKKINGRKRHVVVDTMGNLLSVFILVANIHEENSEILLRKASCIIHNVF